MDANQNYKNKHFEEFSEPAQVKNCLRVFEFEISDITWWCLCSVVDQIIHEG